MKYANPQLPRSLHLSTMGKFLMMAVTLYKIRMIVLLLTCKEEERIQSSHVFLVASLPPTNSFEWEKLLRSMVCIQKSPAGNVLIYLELRSINCPTYVTYFSSDVVYCCRLGASPIFTIFLLPSDLGETGRGRLRVRTRIWQSPKDRQIVCRIYVVPLWSSRFCWICHTS